ncbi:MAG: hypothetical protein PHC85_00785 [Candidatus Pacebacteria bacterium]|nr:hypothetical protein [Candidatus Paceibacterota bacterium]
MKKRIFSLLVMIAALFFLPLEACGILFVLAVSFSFLFYEGILVGFLADFIYIQPGVFSRISFGFFALVFAAAFFSIKFTTKIFNGRSFLSKMPAILAGLAIFSAAYFFLKFF